MSKKTFAVITDIHANTESLEAALSVINNREGVDQIICLGDCFPLGPNPEESLELLLSIKDCIYIRGNHDRYILERLWEQEQPTLEGMDPYDPICQEIVQNIKWASQRVGNKGVDFIKTMHVAHREIIEGTLVEFTHAWYQRDDQPPTIEEASNWKDHVIAKNDFIGFKSNKTAIKTAVHAPVTGSGNPTKSNKPKYPHFSIFSLFLIELFSHF